jgi:RNase adaptor protein for sRNA GlmZ degradation
MPKRSRKARDENESAFDVIQQIIGQSKNEGKNPLAVALGRLGGLKGGKARAEKLTPEQRRKSALKAARARWKKKS